MGTKFLLRLIFYLAAHLRWASCQDQCQASLRSNSPLIPEVSHINQSFPLSGDLALPNIQAFGRDSPFNHNRPIDSLHSIIENTTVTALQQHVLFWDRNGDGIITVADIYIGFRSLGFSVPYSTAGLLINFFFSYPTRLAYSYLPDPLFRIYVPNIHKAKHGSDTGVYDFEGHFRPLLFEELFAKFDRSNSGGLGVDELFELLSKDRVAADPAGWSFAFMEWGTTWLLLQREGKVWKDDLRQAYDGSLFWRIRDERENRGGWGQGYGWREFLVTVKGNRSWKECILG